VKEFWVIYREVVKDFSIYELQKKHEFDLKIMRSAKQFFFAKYNFDCLAEQTPGASQLFDSLPEYMEYS
jgi:hypothetical protein